VLSIAISLNVFKESFKSARRLFPERRAQAAKIENLVVKTTMRLYGGTTNIVQNLQDANLVIRGED
jgi:hypothetical protein